MTIYPLSNSFEFISVLQQLKHENFVKVSILVKEAPLTLFIHGVAWWLGTWILGPAPGSAVTYCMTVGKLLNLTSERWGFSWFSLHKVVVRIEQVNILKPLKW